MSPEQSRKLCGGIELRIGEQTQIVNDDEDHISFSLVQGDDEQTIQKGIYKGAMR
jgi:hypothetical protein